MQRHARCIPNHDFAVNLLFKSLLPNRIKYRLPALYYFTLGILSQIVLRWYRILYNLFFPVAYQSIRLLLKPRPSLYWGEYYLAFFRPVICGGLSRSPLCVPFVRYLYCNRSQHWVYRQLQPWYIALPHLVHNFGAR